MSILPRPSLLTSTKIPVPTTCLVALDHRLENEVLSNLNRNRKGEILVWRIPHASDTAHWDLGFLKNISNHIRNRRFDNISQLYLIGNPYHTSQVRTLSMACAAARVFFVGPELNTPMPTNGKHRNIINAVRDMKRRGHHCEIIDPATTVENIVRKICAKPAHQDAPTRDGLSSQGITALSSVIVHTGTHADFAGMSQR